MANNYQKVAQLYTLSGSGITTITGASVIHALYNGSNAQMTMRIDDAHTIHIPTDQHVTFPNPVAFSTIRNLSATNTGVILYS
jgi:hypothetical protein